MQSQMQSQGLTLPPKAKVGPSAARVSTKDIYGLYVDDSSSRLFALRRAYEESITVHNVALGNDQVKVGIEEV